MCSEHEGLQQKQTLFFLELFHLTFIYRKTTNPDIPKQMVLFEFFLNEAELNSGEPKITEA